MKQILQFNRFMVMLIAMLTLSLTNAFAGDAVCKTSLFAEANNSGKISSYTSNWYSTTDGFRLNIVNFNNNSNGWSGTIKAGGKKSKAADPAKASTASFATNDTINSKVTKIVVTGSLANNSSFTSTTLTIANDKDLSSGVVEIDGPTTFSSGVLTFTVSGTNLPAAGKYYKLTFNISNNTTTNGCFSVTKVEFYKETGGGDKVETPAFMIGGTEVTSDAAFCGAQDVTISCSTAGAAISYSTNGGTSWNAYSKPIEVTETATLQAKATKSGLTDSEVNTKIFTINAPIANDSASAYTTAKAIEKIDAGKCLTDTVFVKGTISKIDSYSSKYYSITYWLDNNTFQVYSGKGLNGANFSSIDDIKVGAEVVVKGLIKKFVSGETTTYEFDYNNYLVAYKAPEVPKTTATITLSGYKQTLAMDDPANVVTIKYNGDGQLSAESSDPTKATVAVTVNETDTFVTVTPVAATETPVTITVSAPETDNFTSASKYYTLTVSAGLTAANLPFSFDGGVADINPANGIKQSGLGKDYTASPKLKFDGTADEVVIKVAEKAAQLTYTVKGNTFSNGTFDVMESADGIAYTSLKSYTTLEDAQNDTVTPKVASRFFKFVYTAKSSGNVALGNINIIANLPKKQPDFTVEDLVMQVETDSVPSMDKDGSTGAVTYKVPDNNYFYEEGGRFYAAYAGGPVTVTAYLAETDEYLADTTTFDVTVKDEEFAFKTITSFALEAGYMEMFQYKAFKGNSITEPAVYSEVLRIYKPGSGETTGGYITLTALPGYKIRGVEMPITKSANTVGYAVDGGEAPASGTAVSKGESYKLTGIECNSVSLYNMGTDRIDISSIIIYYSGELESVSTLAVAGATKTVYEIDDEIDHAGAVVTATFASGEFDVTLNTTWVDPDMTTAGQKQVKATFASKEATYDITVNEPAPATLDTIKVSGEYQKVFQMGAEFNHDNAIVTAYYSDASDSTVTDKATFSTPDMSVAGKQNVTVSYGGKSTSYSITITAAPGTMAKEKADLVAEYAGLANGTDLTKAPYNPLVGASFTLTYSKGTNESNAPKYYTSQTQGQTVRAYVGNTITIVAVDSIIAIDVNFVSGYADEGMTITYSADGKTATLTFSGTCRFTEILVYYQCTDTLRDNLSVGAYGTVCSKKNIVCSTGATFYQVDYINKSTNELIFNEVEAGDTLKAGKAYLFKAGAQQIKMVACGAEVAEPLSGEDARGFYGLFESFTIDAAYTYYGIYGDKIQPIAQGVIIPAGRSYIKLDELKEETYVPVGVAVRRLAFGTPKGAATGLDAMFMQEGIQKMIVNGQLLIVRDGKMFNAQGQVIK